MSPLQEMTLRIKPAFREKVFKMSDFRHKRMPRDAQFTIQLLEGYIDNFFPGSRHRFTLFDHVDTQDGFAVYVNGGLSLFYIDASSGDQWFLQLCTALAVDLTDITGCLLWTNAKNRWSSLDRYYCAMTQDGEKCAVAAEATVSSLLLNDFLQPGREIIPNYLKSVAKNTITTAQVDAEELLNGRTGRRLMPSDQDLMILFSISSA